MLIGRGIGVRRLTAVATSASAAMTAKPILTGRRLFTPGTSWLSFESGASDSTWPLASPGFTSRHRLSRQEQRDP